MNEIPINLEMQYNLTEDQYRIVEDNLVMVVRMAKAYTGGNNTTTFFDCIHAGNQSLFYAVERGETKPERLLLFIGYAIKKHLTDVGIND